MADGGFFRQERYNAAYFNVVRDNKWWKNIQLLVKYLLRNVK